MTNTPVERFWFSRNTMKPTPTTTAANCSHSMLSGRTGIWYLCRRLRS